MSDQGFDQRQTVQPPGQGSTGRRHGWLMIACCIPMIAIAIALVVTGVVSPGFLLIALICVAMMALMMRGMDRM